MQIHYYGLNPVVLFAIAILLGLGATWFYFYQLKLKRANTGTVKLLVACLVSSMALLWCGEDLSKPISSADAEKLHSYYEAAAASPINGYEFRQAMGELAEENDIIVIPETSHLGANLYTTYVTKKDWNDLALIFNDSNIIK